MSKDNRLYGIIADLANSNQSAAIEKYQSILQDRITEATKQFVYKQRITTEK